MSFPKITIVTPSYNQGQFIEETILSVIGQNYPNLEYIVIDGGSTDNSLEIIKRYEKYISYWVSEKDHGQSHAINKGFALATGDILAWLNSDDMYMPGFLFKMAELYRNTNLKGIFFGNCIHMENCGGELKSYGSNVLKYKNYGLELFDYIIQPSSFWSRQAWNTIGPLREDLHFGFDWEWFLRAEKMSITFTSFDYAASVYRIHSQHKSGSGGKKRHSELLKIYLEYNSAYSDLFEKLSGEEISSSSLVYRIIKTLRGILRMDVSHIAILRTLKRKKYSRYSYMQMMLVDRIL